MKGENILRYKIDFSNGQRYEGSRGKQQGAPASPCETRGHQWRITSLEGYFRCQTCHAMGCCPECVTQKPLGAMTVFCSQHRGQQ